MRMARPTTCTRALGVCGTSARKTRRTPKKLTPSEHVDASATITRKRSPRRLLSAELKAVYSSIVATPKPCLAPKFCKCPRSADIPVRLSTKTRAFVASAAMSHAMMSSFGAHTWKFLSTRALLPFLPSWRLAKWTHTLQYALRLRSGMPFPRFSSYFCKGSPNNITLRTNCLRKLGVKMASGMPAGSDRGNNGVGRIGKDDIKPSSQREVLPPLIMSSKIRPSCGSLSIGVPVKPASTAPLALESKSRNLVNCSPYCVCERTRLCTSSMTTIFFE
mmetsp:Transcript_135347/g.432758  ORF Transcript_135347/g.432758 Transcript_135347/m.432758 type:complete len:276 (+) Transcript_135347:2037-2864(+)